MKSILIFLGILLFGNGSSFACERMQSQELENWMTILNSIEGEQRLGGCDIYIETKKECIHNKEHMYVSIFLTKDEHTRQIPMVFNNSEQSLSFLRAREGSFRLLDIDTSERPRIYEDLRISFDSELKFMKFKYEKYYKDSASVVRKTYIDKLSCVGRTKYSKKDLKI